MSLLYYEICLFSPLEWYTFNTCYLIAHLRMYVRILVRVHALLLKVCLQNGLPFHMLTKLKVLTTVFITYGYCVNVIILTTAWGDDSWRCYRWISLVFNLKDFVQKNSLMYHPQWLIFCCMIRIAHVVLIVTVKTVHPQKIQNFEISSCLSDV